MAVGAGRLVLVGEPLEHLDLGLAVLDDRGRLGLGLELAGLEIGSGRNHHIGFHPALLQLDALRLQLLAGYRLGRLPGHQRLLLTRPGDGLELGGAHPQRVLLLDDLLVGLDLGDLRGAASGRLGLLGLRLAVGLSHPGVPLHLGGEAPSHRLEIVHVVGDVLDLEHVEFQTQGLDVVVGLVDELVAELEPVLVDLLGGHGGQHAPQVGLQGLFGDLADVHVVDVKEALGGILEQSLAA